MHHRSVIEIMVLSFTLLVGASLIGLGVTVCYVLIANPETDVDRLVATLASMLSAILGALLGLIAGRASTSELHQRPDGQPDSIKELP